MIDINIIDKIIEKRKTIHPDDPLVLKIWDELTEIFVQDEKSTISYLNNCPKENISWISEIFEDISEKLQSLDFIKCIEQLSMKYPDLNLEQDIQYAKQVCKLN